MGIISEVKCGRCDRRFSGLRSRCPYCGARRGKRGKQSYESENSKAKMIIGVALMLVLIVAVAVLLITSLSDKTNPDDVSSPPPSIPDSDGVDGADGSSPPPSPDVDDDPVTTSPDVPVAVIESIKIMYAGYEKTDVTVKIGEKLKFDTKTVPADTDEPVVWTSSNEAVFVVLSTGQVTGIAVGDETLTVTCGDATWECIIRVRK